MTSQASLLSRDRTPTSADPQAAIVPSLIKQLESEGIVRLPRLITDDCLRDMQQAFAARLGRMRWNNGDGYERTERYRYMVQDVLTLAQGFVDVPLHPMVQAVVGQYVGPGYALCEAKGWRSLPTRRDFHGWHGDKWYDQTQVTGQVPREVKLAIYLTDVRSGAFQYIKGSHGQAPQHLCRAASAALPLDRMEELLGPAGSAFLFDTSGVHRQGIPILEPRQAVFYNYHDPSIPLQQEDRAYYRYHPLVLNAAFLGGLTAEDYRVLGFGDKTHYQANFIRRPDYPAFQALVQCGHDARMFVAEWSRRIGGKLWRVLHLR